MAQVRSSIGRRVRSRRGAVALAVIPALTAGLFVFESAGAHASASARRVRHVTAPARCATATTVVWFDTAGNGAAGSVYYHVEFTNLSGRRCRLYGYPGLSAVDLSGRQIGKAARRAPTPRPRDVVLAAGGTANAAVQIVQAQNYPKSRCQPQRAAGLRVYLPGSYSSKVVPFPFLACANRSADVLGVGALQPGLVRAP